MLKNNHSEKKNKYALVSVSDKTGIEDFAKTLVETGFTIISTGGTAKLLTEKGIDVIPIQDVTGNPESFDGRMKTISFQVESGILFDRDKKTHQQEAKKLNIKPIDLVVCNLYPFEEAVKKESITDDDAVESIDVGGPTMIRAAAKNFKHVLVVVDPNDYEEVAEYVKTASKLIRHPEQSEGSSHQKSKDFPSEFTLSETNVTQTDIRKSLAEKAFYHLSFYDSQIAEFLRNTVIARSKATKRSHEIATPSARDDSLFPTEITLPGRKVMDLRYGENPHQKGSIYISPKNNSPFANLQKHWGRDLSLTNVTDINAGIESVRLFDEPCAVVIKHNNPCGVALGETIGEALKRAIDADPESAFGGVIVLNKPVNDEVVSAVEIFKKEGRGNFDIISAPSIPKTNLTKLSSLRKSMGIYTFGSLPQNRMDTMQVKWIDGGFLHQTGDNDIEKQFADWKVVTKKKPSAKQISQMKTAWLFISKIKSNSILIMDKDIPQTRGIGSGQTSRIRSTKIAFEQAGEYAKGAILASDSFFPFDDSIRLAGKHGIKAIVQQGGSINDRASIEAANELGIAMVFTGYRAFWH